MVDTFMETLPTFEEYVMLREGGMVSDDQAEEGKSKPKQRPSTMGAKNLQKDNSGTAGGTGKGPQGSGGAPASAGPTPGPQQQPAF